MTELLSNNAQTTLSAAITSTSATTLSVTSATAFPSGGNFRIIVDSEIMLVTGVSGTTFTVTRGIEGTTAATHSNGATLTHVLTGGAMDVLRGDFCQEGTMANLPASSKNGILYFPDDGQALNRDTGSQFNQFGPLYRMYTPPAAGNWTGFGSPPALDSSGSGLYLANSGGSGANLQGYTLPAPSTPYIIDALVMPLLTFYGTLDGGLCWRNSSSGKIETFGWTATGGGASPSLQWIEWTNPTTYSATRNFLQASGSLVVWANGLIWLRLKDDGTNRTVWISQDGQRFIEIGTCSSTDFATPNEVGFYLDNEQTTFASGTLLLSWRQH